MKRFVYIVMFKRVYSQIEIAGSSGFVYNSREVESMSGRFYSTIALF